MKTVTATLDYPNVINKKAPNFGCFLCEEAVEAAKACGVLLRSYPAEIMASDLYHCKLLEDKRNCPLFIVELEHGTDENVFRNMAAALYSL